MSIPIVVLKPPANGAFAALDGADFYSLSVVRSGVEWQANLAVEPGNSFRIRHGATPSEAIAALFVADAPLAPPPY